MPKHVYMENGILYKRKNRQAHPLLYSKAFFSPCISHVLHSPRWPPWSLCKRIQGTISIKRLLILQRATSFTREILVVVTQSSRPGDTINVPLIEDMRSSRKRERSAVFPLVLFHSPTIYQAKLIIQIDASIIKLRDLPELEARDAGTVLATNHFSSTKYSPSDPYSTVFTGNNTCILVPEVTEGPFYVTGEYVRADVRETATQSGIDLILDIEVIDTSTCEPVPNVYVDFWYANSTGAYSGITDASSPSNINATYARGIQSTGSEGATQFTAFYPGHYQGRTQHIHVATHVGGT